ncbi:energy transducer TonB [Flavobacteriaceae bacterium GSB9]|nr:energy transducer TonB [Flavobacteriaceae bacterium GSB9]
MRQIILFLFLAFSICAISQNRHPDGPYKEYHKNGQLRKEGFYKNNNKISVWKEYYDSGQLKRVYTFGTDGRSTGIEELYSKNGHLISEKKPVQNGGLIYRGYFENGNMSVTYALMPSNNKKYFVKAGGYKDFYENGTLKTECIYSNNELSGPWKQFYDTGEKEWEVEYFKGYKQGVYKQFYKSGQLKLEGSHVTDFLDGEEKRYNESGHLIWKGEYSNGDFDGVWSQYDSLGNIVNELKYKKGKLKRGGKSVKLESTKIPDGLLERVPVYPGCELFPGNNAKRKCMSEKIAEFINKEFNPDVVVGTGIYGKQLVNVIFKIDKTGSITGVRVRAKHPDLEKEAIRAVRQLPKMVPGYQKGKAVIVPYSLPIFVSATVPRSKLTEHYKTFSE